jgi:membrane-associated phospholipid phosphatase
MIEVLKSIDIEVLVTINRQCENTVLDFLCPIFREKLTWIPLYFLVLLFLIKIEKWHAIVWVIAALFAVSLSDQLGLMIKNLVQRPRPCQAPLVVGLIHLKVASCSQHFSFISNHAANHFAQAILYSSIFKNRWVTTSFLIWAIVVSISQIYVGVHYPLDVMVGALIGIVIGFVSYYLGRAGIVFFMQNKSS